MRTIGRRRRSAANASRSRVAAFSFTSSLSRASCHSAGVAMRGRGSCFSSSAELIFACSWSRGITHLCPSALESTGHGSVGHSCDRFQKKRSRPQPAHTRRFRTPTEPAQERPDPFVQARPTMSENGWSIERARRIVWFVNEIPGLDLRALDRARVSRDPRFDGKFFIAVTSTGIYCRPICPVRSPKRVHIRYYRTAAEAAEAGFRPCLHCRPEAAPGTPAWQGTSAVVRRALRLID